MEGPTVPHGDGWRMNWLLNPRVSDKNNGSIAVALYLDDLMCALDLSCAPMTYEEMETQLVRSHMRQRLEDYPAFQTGARTISDAEYESFLP
jgi:hypothetical protein